MLSGSVIETFGNWFTTLGLQWLDFWLAELRSKGATVATYFSSTDNESAALFW